MPTQNFLRPFRRNAVAGAGLILGGTQEPNQVQWVSWACSSRCLMKCAETQFSPLARYGQP